MTAGRRPGGTAGGSAGPHQGPRTGAGPRPGSGARTGVRPPPAVAGRPARPVQPSRPSRMLRLVVLGGVLSVLAVLLAPALRSYLGQQQQITALQDRVAQQRSDLRGLERERSTWDDPAFIKAQARERLKFVMPGERAYTVIDAGPTSAPRSSAGPPSSPVRAAASTARGDRAWFGNVWRSVQVAGGAAPRGR